jgi:hypothetical protein
MMGSLGVIGREQFDGKSLINCRLFKASATGCSPGNFYFTCSFSSTWKKTNQKKTPVSRGPYGAALRVAAATGARGNSPAFAKASADSDRSARLNPVASSMLGAGQRGLTPENQTAFQLLAFDSKRVFDLCTIIRTEFISFR